MQIVIYIIPGPGPGIIICVNILIQHYSDTLTEVELYIITIIDSGNISPILLSADSLCNSNGCYYNLDVSQLNHTRSNISVTITATNVVGEGPPAICNDNLIIIGKNIRLPTSDTRQLLARLFPLPYSYSCQSVAVGTITIWINGPFYI